MHGVGIRSCTDYHDQNYHVSGNDRDSASLPVKIRYVYAEARR